MINIRNLHWEFTERVNRSSSNLNQDFTPAQIDQFIHNSVRTMVQDLGKKEDDVYAMDFIGSLIVTAPDQPAVKAVKVSSGRYELNLADLAFDYFHYKRLFLNQECRFVKVTMVGEGQLNDILSDYLQRPSKKWNRVYGYVAKATAGKGRSIFLLCENIDVIDKVDIEYIRYPKKVFFGGYNSVEYLDCVSRGGVNCKEYYSATSPIVDLDFDPVYSSAIVDGAVLEAFRTIENMAGFNLITEKLTHTT